ncbi:MAG TPA: hypothetical protein VKS22_14675 [Candidatus Binataceae bacterium]|nr:hypothetical protein [Candidatus Binataceae bacterium]
MKIANVSVGLLAAVLVSGVLAPVYAQPAATQAQAQDTLKRVGPEVWNARRSSEHNAQMLQAYKAGEDAYFKGNYDKAIKKLNAAEAMTKNSPNNYGGGAP